MDSLSKYQSKSITPVDEYKCTLSEELREIARTELHETDKVRTNAIETIRDWVMNNPRIIRCRLDANFILRFLRFRKYDIAETKEAFERYLILREGAYGDDWLSNLDVKKSNVFDLIDKGAFYIFPKLDSDGRLIFLHRYAAVNPKNPRVAQDFMTLVVLVLEIMYENEEHQIRGFQYILDCADIGLKYYNLLPFSTAFKYAKNSEKICTSRHKGIHPVNVNPAYWFLVKFGLKQVPQKIRDRIHFHANYDDLDIVKKAELPVECGGEVDLYEFNESWKQILASREEFFLNYSNMKIDRSYYPSSVLKCEVNTLNTPLETPGFLKKKL